MREKPRGPLRRGWTTGACAAAAAKAAYSALLTGEFPDPIEVTHPRGDRPSFPPPRQELTGDRATAGIIKDAGDDPDVTHHALIVSSVRRLPAGSGLVFCAGGGGGIVTRPRFRRPGGAPAINPMPREIMRLALGEVAASHRVDADVEITLSVPGGPEIATRTWNPPLRTL